MNVMTLITCLWINSGRTLSIVFVEQKIMRYFQPRRSIFENVYMHRFDRCISLKVIFRNSHYSHSTCRKLIMCVFKRNRFLWNVVFERCCPEISWTCFCRRKAAVGFVVSNLTRDHMLAIEVLVPLYSNNSVISHYSDRSGFGCERLTQA